MSIRAIEDGALVALAAVDYPLLYLVDHIAGFFLFVEGGVEVDQLALFAVAPEVFTVAFPVVFDQAVGGF